MGFKDAVRNKMGYMNKGGMPKKKGYAKGGKMNDMRKTGMFYGGMSRRGKTMAVTEKY